MKVPRGNLRLQWIGLVAGLILSAACSAQSPCVTFPTGFVAIFFSIAYVTAANLGGGPSCRGCSGAWGTELD